MDLVGLREFADGVFGRLFSNGSAILVVVMEMLRWPYGLVAIALIVAVDFLFLRHNAWARLIVNIGIVAVFLAIYLVFLRK